MFESMFCLLPHTFFLGRYRPPRRTLSAWFVRMARGFMLALFLLVGCALAAVALLRIGYAQQGNTAHAWVTYPALLGLLLWFTWGAWKVRQQQRRSAEQLAYCDAYVQRHASTTPARYSIDALTSDDPQELRAFWAQSLSAATPVLTAPRPAPRRASAHAIATPPAAASLTLPVSLFGAYLTHEEDMQNLKKSSY